MKRFLKVILIVISQFIIVAIYAQSLQKGFINPPDSARPWVYWFWLNGNLSKEGITADLESMKRVGIGGVLIMEVNQGTPKGSYVFGSTEWRELFKYMLNEANRLGLKVNLNNDAGWCGSGGPWITPEKSMQKIVWTETMVHGAKKINSKLPQPKAVNGYYGDIMVLAYPTPEGDDMKVSDYNPEIRSSFRDSVFDGKKLIDCDEKSQIELSKPTPDKPQYFDFIFPRPYTSHLMTIHLGVKQWSVHGTFQVSNNGVNFTSIKEFEGDAPSITLEYKEQTARWYRINFDKVTKEETPLEKIAISEVEISNGRLDKIEQKALFQQSAKTIIVPAEFQSINTKYIIPGNKVLDITDKMKSDGSIVWDIPQGKWTIVRIGHTTTGKLNNPAPEGGLGYECDKLSKEASTLFFNGFIQKIAKDSKSNVGKSFVSTHIDSWEVGLQNWTPGFYEEFRKRRGYDPIPYIPVTLGRIVDNMEISERFLWDLRTTVSEMMLENYAENIQNLAHQNGLHLSIEAYDKCLTDEMTYAGRADEPMAEFWSWNKYRYGFSCTEMSSAAHVYGKKIIGAEAFTAFSTEKWLSHPANIKDLGDWAFCEGINRFVFHRFAMQPYENIKPGISMGPWGLHYERTQTWWEQSLPWHQYLARCQYLLQQGLFVADICYLAPEATPQTWHAPYKRDSTKYNFDGCPSEVVLKFMSVKNGRIVLPDGMNYKLLVLPACETMTPKLLHKIKELAEAGATIIGAPPKKALGLSNYPKSDEEIKELAAEIWGRCDGKVVKVNCIGKGRIIYGETPEEVLSEMQVKQDFSSEIFLRYTHRNINGIDVYFVANPSQSNVLTTCQFRIQGRQPEIWNPMTGKIEKIAQYEETNGSLKMPIRLEPAGSVFVVFRPENKINVSVKKLIRNGGQVNVEIIQNNQNGFEMNLAQSGKYKLATSDGKNYNFEIKTISQPMLIKGRWEVKFINRMGGTDKTTFEDLISWSDRNEKSIKYYSGGAVYSKNISISKAMIGKDKKLKLDLGKVEVMSEVKVNGKLIGILWKEPYCIDITDAVKMGTNKIEIKVVNLWVNRLIGDEQIPDSSERKNGSLLSWPKWVIEGKSNPTGRYSFTTWKVWKKDSPLLESGLLGPVRIISEKHITLKE
ncbi:MAG: glycosyl hydrolase [Flavisolibacter sp.]